MSGETGHQTKASEYTIEGELVNSWMEYEYDDLEIDGKRLQDLLMEALPYGELDRRYSGQRRFGRVRLTVEILR